MAYLHQKKGYSILQLLGSLIILKWRIKYISLRFLAGFFHREQDGESQGNVFNLLIKVLYVITKCF